MAFLQVALNGDRRHDAVPKTPAAIAAAAEAAVCAGAQSVHVHVYDAKGRETLHAAECGAVVTAIRDRCPGVPISLTTSATIISDPAERLAVVKEWSVFPDLVTANQGEPGIVELAEWLLEQGVGIEAGLLEPNDARLFATSTLVDRCRRILIEPLDSNPDVAMRDAAEMEAILASAGITLPQVHHGIDGSCWAVNRRALERGHGMRTGMEDVVMLPDGRPARDNTDLVVAARSLIAAVTAAPSYRT